MATALAGGAQHQHQRVGQGKSISARIQSQIQDLLQEKNVLQGVADKWQTVAQEQEQQTKTLQRNLLQVTAHRDTLTVALETRDAQLTNLTEKLKTVEEKHEEACQQLQLVQKEVATSAQLAERVIQTRANLESQLEAISGDMTALQRREADLDAELQAARNKLSAMALDLNTSQHEASRLSVDNSRLVQDVKAWAERHEATVDQLRTAEAEVQARQASIEASAAERVQLEQRLQEQAETQARLEEEGVLQRTTAAKLRKLRQEIELLELAKSELEASKSQVLEEMKQKEQFLLDSEAQVADWKQKLETCIKERDAQAEENSILRTEKDQLLAEHQATLVNMQSEAQATEARLGATLEALNVAHDKLVVEHEDLKRAIATHEAAAREKADEISSSERALQEAQQVIKASADKLQEVDDKSKALEEQLQLTQARQAEDQKCVKKLQDTLQTLEAAKCKADAELDMVKNQSSKQREEANDAYQSLQAELDAERAKLQRAHEETKQIRAACVCAATQNQLEQCQAELEKAHERTKVLQEGLKSAYSKIAHLEKQAARSNRQESMAVQPSSPPTVASSTRPGWTNTPTAKTPTARTPMTKTPASKQAATTTRARSSALRPRAFATPHTTRAARIRSPANATNAHSASGAARSQLRLRNRQKTTRSRLAEYDFDGDDSAAKVESSKKEHMGLFFDETPSSQ
ncbi:uncharacterized protein MONBRDRAFT_25674 [Monosiga brevicollis MX1]|uniref:Uncharacterized protein n=1 Tax=Monosiga brevicollis TaxID=81824 RepID=A9V034_MONBE|nr:uncharacterized protein MONBRDRAFT_25674 [Monosiga brevicollis MX1]EDQ89088.1 predicted protein [Monosiga brevicollis MX1]|eukprot:XP_001746193.1 hypothetical protein [Monosiga brevicollis MX1]